MNALDNVITKRTNILDNVLLYFTVQIDEIEGSAARAELAALRASVATLTAQNTEQARQLSEARNLIDQSCSDAVAIVNMSDGYIYGMASHLANQLGAWLAANAPTPQAEQAAHDAPEGKQR